MTDFLNATLDGQQRQNLLAELSAYADTDMLCYFADEPRLYAQQVRLWEPILRSVEAQFKLQINRTRGVMPAPQPTELKQQCQQFLAEYNDSKLVAAAQMVTRLGSVLLAFALAKGLVTLEQALEAASLDEGYQASEWGADESITARLNLTQARIKESYAFLQQAAH